MKFIQGWTDNIYAKKYIFFNLKKEISLKNKGSH